jgi:hypothetical protein
MDQYRQANQQSQKVDGIDTREASHIKIGKETPIKNLPLMGVRKDEPR